jgi:hypothetical protein
MPQKDGVEARWINGSIKAIVEYSLLSHYRYVLISSLDSCVEIAVSHIGSKLITENANWYKLGNSIVAEGAGIAEAHKKHNLFNGFDEIWCFNSMPLLLPPSTIVAPFDASTERLDTGVIGWMEGQHCALGLGDGIGLNVAFDDPSHFRRVKDIFSIDT